MHLALIKQMLQNRIIQIPILILYTCISFAIYIYINDKLGNIKEVFGTNISKIIKKLFKHKNS